MQRLSHITKLLSKTSRNLSKTYPFQLNPKIPPQYRHGFSSGMPRNGFSGRISDGFCSNPIIGQVIQRAQSISLFQGAMKGFGAQYSKRSYYSRARYGSWFQQLTVDGVVIGLIVANAAVFLLWRIADQSFMIKNFTISLDNIWSGRIHTVITSAFSHIDTGHIISNMIGLYFFGTSLGRTFGPEFVLKLYLAGAVGGSVFYLAHHGFMALSSKNRQPWGLDPSRARGLGASGAVNAIMLLDIFLYPRKTLYFDFFIPVPAMLLGIFLIGKDMLRILEGDSQISGSAHLGGAAVAAAAWALQRKGRLRF